MNGLKKWKLVKSDFGFCCFFMTIHYKEKIKKDSPFNWGCPNFLW